MQGVKAILLAAVLGAVIALTSHAGMAGEAGRPEEADGTATLRATEANGNDTGSKKLLLNFQDAPLQTVLEYLSETVRLTIISDVALDGRITVISRQPITVDEAVRLINSVLKEMDMAAVRNGEVLKIVMLRQARQMNIPVSSGWDPKDLPDGDETITHVLPLRYVTAAALRQNLMSLLPEYATIEANADGNALIITDTTANIKRLMKIVQALDTHMASVAEIRVFRLINADATSAANLINSLFQQDARATQQGARGNIVEMMMGRGGPGGGAGDAAGQSTGAGRVQVVAAADSRTNAVVVRASVEALAIIADMLAALDDRTAVIADVRVFQLRYADALGTADMINRLFGQGAGTARNQQDAGPAAIFGMRGGPQMQQIQAAQDDPGATLGVVAAADSRTNTVVVTGPEAMLNVLAAMVERLDTPVANVADVKVFHLKYANASNTASLVNEIFGASRTTAATRTGGQQNQQIQFAGRGGFGQQQATQGTDTSVSDVPVVASADTRTNAVVVSGPAETLLVVATVIEGIDQNPTQERQIFVYPLKNGTASNLATILNNLFSELQALNQQGTGAAAQQFRGGGAGGAAGGMAAGATAEAASSASDLSEETYLEADTETNSLLVMTSTKNYEKIKPIIDQLDKPVGQVLIKVLFAEITHSKNVDLGLEFAAWNLRGEDNENVDVDVATLFGYPAGGIPGLTASVLDRNLDVTVRALQQTGKLNILSRPYILTSNQQTATITVGNQVPFALGSTTVAGQTQITTEYRDIGIILSVTPSINPDGLVIMTVRPEISSTTGDSVQVSSELSLPVFATRTSETKVAVHNGQTIVIGGLIQDEIRNTVRKVPLLGDIPLAGALFRRTQKENAKTELLIFLTPHVAADVLELAPISDAERRRSNLGNDATIAEIYQGHLRGMGGPGNVDAQFDSNEPNGL